MNDSLGRSPCASQLGREVENRARVRGAMVVVEVEVLVVWGVFPRRAWQHWLTNVGPPGWSELLWNHTADSRQWTTHSANRPCVLHNTREEEGSRYNGACCSRTRVSAGKLWDLRPGVYQPGWAVTGGRTNLSALHRKPSDHPSIHCLYRLSMHIVVSVWVCVLK